MSGRIHVSNAIPALLLGLLIWGMSGVDIQAQTQMKNRDFLHLGDPEPYLNYGRTMFEPYPDVLTSRNQYDRLGNFLKSTNLELFCFSLKLLLMDQA